MGVKRFEEMESWKRARELTRRVYLVTAEGAFGRDFGLKDQIRRASTSIMANIAEGFGRDGHAEFAHFLGIARGSAMEVQSLCYVALDQGFIDDLTFTEMNGLAHDTANLIAAFQRTL